MCLQTPSLAVQMYLVYKQAWFTHNVILRFQCFQKLFLTKVVDASIIGYDWGVVSNLRQE